MKTTFLLLALCTSLQAGGPSLPVEADTHNNWKVTADGVIAIESPTGNRVIVSEQFITPNTNWTPSNIQCVWGDRLVAIFAQHPRLTEIVVFDTKTQQKLTQQFSKKMPAWYEECRVIKDRPNGKWEKNTLQIETVGFPANGNPHKMTQVLKVADGTFVTQPIQASPSEARPVISPKLPVPGAVPAPEPQRSLDFGSP